MNLPFSPPRRCVDLAIAPPFALGSLQVVPNALEVRGPGGVQTLEPRIMQVLVALHEALGEPVSRNDFSELCWDGRIVGEDALFRCIGRLRKALAGDPRVVIDTIPKVGYRLRVAPAEVAAPEPPAAAAAPARTEPRRAMRPAMVAAVAVGLVAVVGGGLFVADRLRPAGAWAADGMRPLTAEPGIETHPALSPDGRFLVYAASPTTASPRDLYLRGVREGAPLRLTSGGADEFSAAWAPSGDRIAFVRQTGGEPCRIVVLPVPRGAERTVGRCMTTAYTRLAWLDERTILLSDRAGPTEVQRIRALDIETGAVRDVTRPGPDSVGDSEPLPTPDGRGVVFRRSTSHGVDDLYLVDTRTGEERPLKRDGWKALGYAWAADGRTLFYATNRGGDFGLWSLDTRKAAEPQRVSLGLMTFGSMSSDRAGRLAVEAIDRQKNLFRVDAAGAVTTLTASTGRDWDPDVSIHGSLVYVSDQGGPPDVWIKREGEDPAQLTQLRASFLQYTRWSPDGRRIAFIAAKDHKTDLWVINADGSGLAKVTGDGLAKASPVWDANGRSLVYAERRGAVVRLMRASLSGGAPVPLPGGANFRTLRPGWDGAFYGQKFDDPRLWRLPHAGGTATPVAPDLRLQSVGWATGPEGIYFVRGGPKPAVWLRTWSGSERKLADLGSVAPGPTIAVDPRTGAVVFPRKLRDESDIALLDMRSRT